MLLRLDKSYLGAQIYSKERKDNYEDEIIGIPYIADINT